MHQPAHELWLFYLTLTMQSCLPGWCRHHPAATLCGSTPVFTPCRFVLGHKCPFGAQSFPLHRCAGVNRSVCLMRWGPRSDPVRPCRKRPQNWAWTSQAGLCPRVGLVAPALGGGSRAGVTAGAQRRCAAGLPHAAEITCGKGREGKMVPNSSAVGSFCFF